MGMELTAELASAMVDYVEQTLPLIEKQAQVIEVVEKNSPSVVDFLIKRGFVTEARRSQAIKAAHDHAMVLEALQKTAEDIGSRQAEKPGNESSPQRIGKSVQIKEAAERGFTPTYARNPRIEEADRSFLRSMGF